METNSVKCAGEYYELMGKKDVEGVKRYLHDNVEFSGPLSTLKGKEAVAESVAGFMRVFKTLTVKAKFVAEDQAVVIYELDIPGIASDFPSASYLTFQDGLIVKIQLFFDGSKFK